MKMHLVDAFSAQPFRGNPAAVVILDSEPTDFAWMQSIGAEMNQSETCFVWPLENNPEADWGLRWFTPEVEIQLCGHATLSSAHMLWSEGLVEANQPVRFFTPMVGHYLSCSLDQENQFIRMSFPAMSVESFDAPAGVIEALGTDILDSQRCANGTLLFEIASDEELIGLKPDFRKLAESTSDVVIVTALSDRESENVVSRFFAPGKGIEEDPVTGSAHCIIGPYWGARLGRTTLVCYQASKRGGILNLELAEDKVYISGQAVTVMQGDWKIDPAFSL
jgi:PhzF family phenazine biosynthesis protein